MPGGGLNSLQSYKKAIRDSIVLYFTS